MNERIIALDIGDARIGVAVSDASRLIATPIDTIYRVGYGPDVRKVVEICQRYDTTQVLSGWPLNMDGTEGERAAKSRKLAKTVEIWSGLPVRMWDERSSTVTAIGFMNDVNKRGKKRKEVLDSAAAAVILESYLAWRKNHPGEV